MIVFLYFYKGFFSFYTDGINRIEGIILAKIYRNITRTHWKYSIVKLKQACSEGAADVYVKRTQSGVVRQDRIALSMVRLLAEG